MSQSLLHQVNDSYNNTGSSKMSASFSRNPFYIRSMIPTDIRGYSCITKCSRNPFYIRSMIPTAAPATYYLHSAYHLLSAKVWFVDYFLHHCKCLKYFQLLCNSIVYHIIQNSANLNNEHVLILCQFAFAQHLYGRYATLTQDVKSNAILFVVDMFF